MYIQSHIYYYKNILYSRLAVLFISANFMEIIQYFLCRSILKNILK